MSKNIIKEIEHIEELLFCLYEKKEVPMVVFAKAEIACGTLRKHHTTNTIQN